MRNAVRCGKDVLEIVQTMSAPTIRKFRVKCNEEVEKLKEQLAACNLMDGLDMASLGITAWREFEYLGRRYRVQNTPGRKEWLLNLAPMQLPPQTRPKRPRRRGPDKPMARIAALPLGARSRKKTTSERIVLYVLGKTSSSFEQISPAISRAFESMKNSVICFVILRREFLLWAGSAVATALRGVARSWAEIVTRVIDKVVTNVRDSAFAPNQGARLERHFFDIGQPLVLSTFVPIEPVRESERLLI